MATERWTRSSSCCLRISPTLGHQVLDGLREAGLDGFDFPLGAFGGGGFTFAETGLVGLLRRQRNLLLQLGDAGSQLRRFIQRRGGVLRQRRLGRTFSATVASPTRRHTSGWSPDSPSEPKSLEDILLAHRSSG